MESQNKVHKVLPSCIKWCQQLSTCCCCPRAIPVRKPNQPNDPASSSSSSIQLVFLFVYSFLHSLGILYAYGYIFGGATLFGAAANATAHWRWYHCGAIDTYRFLFFLLEGVVYGEAPCAVVVHTVCCCCCCCWRTGAAAVLFSLVVVAVVVVINCVCRLRTFFVHK